MKAKVIRPFRDKDTLTVHQKGDVINITEKRFKELSDFYLEEAKQTDKLTPKRSAEGECIPCKKVK